MARFDDLTAAPAPFVVGASREERLAPLIRNLRNRDELADEEAEILSCAVSRFRLLKAADTIIEEGEHPNESCLMVSGLSIRTHQMLDGRSQISAVHVPGDFVDLHGFLLRKLDHSVVALSDCMVAYVPHPKLKAISRDHPHLTRLLWLLTLVDAAIHRRWIATAGRLSSLEQLAHLICELRTRLMAVGLTDGLRFRLPMTQDQIGDAMGLSPVHVNRTVQELRRRELISWQAYDLTIHNWDALRRLAEFDPAYLNLSVRAR